MESKNKIIRCKPYPLEVPLPQAAVIMVNFQRDLVEDTGAAATQGLDVKRMQCVVPIASRLLRMCRKAGMDVVHTVEAHSTNLSDLPLTKFKRGNKSVGQRIGDAGPLGRIMVTSEGGTTIVEGVAPLDTEKVVVHSGKSAFFATDLDEYLRGKHITHLVIAGLTTEMCVEATIRDANDRGYECVLAVDATESYVPDLKRATIDTITSQGGVLGWCAKTEDIMGGLGEVELCHPRPQRPVPDAWCLRKPVNITSIPL